MADESGQAALPSARKIGWGIGGAAEAWMASGIHQFTGPIYTHRAADGSRQAWVDRIDSAILRCDL